LVHTVVHGSVQATREHIAFIGEGSRRNPAPFLLMERFSLEADLL